MSLTPFRSAATEPQSSTACFSVHAVADAGVMPRVMEAFAKRGLVPTTWYSTVRNVQRDDLQIDIQVRDMHHDQREKLAAALRRIVGVEVVLTAEKDAVALSA
ncbi:hypothetical protein [Magnetospira sp. QH-2]|uniref:hypothetical protein n=1 Tax=Magnetospira sp. (strain QH-2) TaxID=1288970 RepID=UPI0003E81256|nr:hypothetical protein [Magnetospira sp. QH-2]CCQ72441.1 conserved protein of unknown function [Magnetospira sp. QH-2]